MGLVTSLVNMGSLLLGLLLCGMVWSSPVPGQADKDRGLVEDIIIGQIEAQILNLLGITTTRATPVLDVVGGIIGGTTTTTQAPASDAGLIQALLGLLFPTTTTSPPPPTTRCGGLIGGGLLC